MGCKSENDDVSVVFVSDKKIKEYNSQYRDKNTATDVLSFPAREGDMPHVEELPLGDILISLETASRQALEIGHSLDDEITRLVIHGVLHLLGYDHIEPDERKKMRAKERTVLKKLTN